MEGREIALPQLSDLLLRNRSALRAHSGAAGTLRRIGDCAQRRVDRGIVEEQLREILVDQTDALTIDHAEPKAIGVTFAEVPALEAAHIRDYHDVQTHTLSNGILFRADIHKLFDSGYVTVTPEMRFEVSRRIKEEFENGRDYYRLHGNIIRPPDKQAHRPDVQALSWHNEERYLG